MFLHGFVVVCLCHSLLEGGRFGALHNADNGCAEGHLVVHQIVICKLKAVGALFLGSGLTHPAVDDITHIDNEDLF